MLLGVVADDFTGASDIANTLARGGMATTQFLGVPKTKAAADCEAGVVALKTRSIPVAEAIAQSMAALEWLRAQGCRQYIFKYCSTFDSTPEGNIGPVGEAIAKALNASGVVACPAFPATGRSVFQGHLFVGDRLLSESSLRNHPLNPMTDSDLRRWLRLQTKEAVGLVPHAIVRKGSKDIAKALADCAARGERLVIVDAVAEDDLMAIGEACAGAPLITGGSGIALGLPRNFERAGLLRGAKGKASGVTGPAAILSGSCSTRTLEQVARHRERHPSLEVQPGALMDGKITVDETVAFINKNAGQTPLVFSSAAPEAVGQAQQRHGREKVAHAIEQFFADVAARVVDQGIRRLVVAGGETSGAVVSALGLTALEIGPEIDPGVPVLYAPERERLALALKSGNFGAVEFFDKALSLMERG
jgi:uncharacterized protein YgbK (DUF1537 family)